jgi:UPF0716 protein FxsA
MRLLLVLFIFWPLLELWLLVKVGASIGAMPVIALVVLGVVLGLAVLRSAGWQALSVAKLRLQQRESPVPALVDGFLFAAAGLLLLLPGLLSDVAALLLLIRPVRHLLSRRWGRFVTAGIYTAGPSAGPDQPTVIDGEYRREPDTPQSRLDRF